VIIYVDEDRRPILSKIRWNNFMPVLNIIVKCTWIGIEITV
jgi:hypothetical protein